MQKQLIITLKSTINLVLCRFYAFTMLKKHRLSWRHSRTLRYSAMVASFTTLLLTLATIAPVYNHVESTEAATSAVNSTLTLNVSKATASIDLSVNSSNGTFISSSDTNSVSFNVSTNNYTGYKLSLSGNDNSQRLTHSSNSSYYLSSITGSVGESDFSANNATAASNYNGKWGYNLTINSGTPSDYLAAPTTTSTPLDETSSANVSGSSNNYKIGIGARASYDTVAGTYTGTYILTVVPNAINYVITYEDPTDEATNIPLEASDSTSQTTITLDSTIPTRTGYTFIGWCLGNITTTSNVDTCTGTVYQPGASFGIDQTTENKPTLLAMWEKDYETMQNLASSSCITSQATKVKDIRDGTIYEVQRLADEKCWLLDNLALDLVANKNVLSETNTNATNTELGYLINGGRSSGSQYPTSGLIDWPAGTSNNYSYSVPYQNTDSKNKTGSGGYAAGKYGVYYNYCAASAGTYCYGSDTSQGSPSGNATADICPKGWRIPTDGSSGEYQALYNQYNAYNAFVAALHTPLSGNYYNGSAELQGSVGNFWSSTYYTAYYMHLLHLVASGVVPAGNGARSVGLSVRCVLDESIKDGMYMQDVTSAMVENTAENATATLIDRRDNKTYTVAKINGNLWMTQNLAITGTISATDSNFTGSDVNISAGDLTSSDYGGSRPPRTHTPTDAELATSGQTASQIGIWYNYCAASAGTVCGYDSEADRSATQDICPSSWRLPTGTNTRALTLAAATDAFRPIYGGYYGLGRLYDIHTVGMWWLSSASGLNAGYWGAIEYRMDDYFNGYLAYGGQHNNAAGMFVRCIFADS